MDLRPANFVGALCLVLAFGGLTQSGVLQAAEPAAKSPAKPGSVVHLEATAEGFRLTRNGAPYFIRGAGGSSFLDLAASCGANSIRTWGEEQAERALDEAQQRGLTVAVGIWLGHERHGFNYNDSRQVAEQLAKARKTIERFKDHPALLVWGIGNEMEGYEQANNAAVWSAVNTVASLAKQLDPHHPTMTVVAELGGERVTNLHRLCPDVDIIGINAYAGIATVAARYRAAGGTKPFVVTEFGPPGPWESPKTAWNAPIELTSTAKAERYRAAYRDTIGTGAGLCLGSYTFVWGHKQETTATWFGMLLPDGTRPGAVDAATEAWTGKPPVNRCPEIERLEVADSGRVAPGATVQVTLTCRDPEGDKLRVEWRLQRDPLSYGTGGDAEASPPYFPDAIVSSSSSQAELHMPREGGGYRIFAYVYDQHGGAAVANVPLYVDAPITKPTARTAKLPLVLYDEAAQGPLPFTPAGYMGATQAIRMDEQCTDAPHAGTHCLRVDFTDAQGWGGVVWQSPASDWGDKPGGFDLTGAKQLVFWARGATGGEVVSFEFGLFDRKKPFGDTAGRKLEKVALTTDWTEHRIMLDSLDLSRIKSGFAWVLAANGKPVRFYLDDIRYE